MPPPELRQYFTTFYLIEITVADGGVLSDFLHPEWGNLRFHAGKLPRAETRDGIILSGTTFAVTGPSSQAVQISVGTTRMWGIGLLPLGWAQFVSAPAADFANAAVDGNRNQAFASFVSLGEELYGDQRDVDAELGRIARYFLNCPANAVADKERIIAVHEALVDPKVATVAGLGARAGIGRRTLERICDRAFGFPPKLLLRRQRFMRSLVDFMLDPSLNWINAIDSQYHDQAQFVRDFRQFMGMTPRAYAALDKPILGGVMRARAAFAGKAVQTLDGPAGVVTPV